MPLGQWLARPAADAPASEMLRWVRRIAVALAVVTLIIAAPRLLLGDEGGWVLAGFGLLLLASAVALTVPIRVARRRERR